MGNAWTPVLGAFNKLCEVEVSSYLGFTLCLIVFTMLELNEAVRGRLIGSKAWNRGGKLTNPCGQPVTVHGLSWVPSLCIYVLMHALMCIRSGMDMKFKFPK